MGLLRWVVWNLCVDVNMEKLTYALLMKHFVTVRAAANTRLTDTTKPTMHKHNIHNDTRNNIFQSRFVTQTKQLEKPQFGINEIEIEWKSDKKWLKWINSEAYATLMSIQIPARDKKLLCNRDWNWFRQL